MVRQGIGKFAAGSLTVSGPAGPPRTGTECRAGGLGCALTTVAVTSQASWSCTVLSAACAAHIFGGPKLFPGVTRHSPRTFPVLPYVSKEYLRGEQHL